MAATPQQHQLEMHIRVKRKDTVLFLYVDPSDTLRDVKKKIEALLGQPSDKQRLMKDDKPLISEGSKLADLQVEYDDELTLVYKIEGDDEWEEPETFTTSGEEASKASSRQLPKPPVPKDCLRLS